MKKLMNFQLLLVAFVCLFIGTTQAQINPTPYLGDVTLKNQQGNAVLDWTIESAGGNNVVMKNDQGYIKEVVWNGNKYSSNKSEAFKFFIDNKDGGIVLKDVNNPDLLYTAKGGNFGNIVMHPYMHDGSTWTVVMNPYLGDVTMDSGRVTIDWTLEAAGGNHIVLKNDQGYVKQVVWKGNQYTSDKNQAMKFVFDKGNWETTRTLRSVDNPDSYYTHKGGNYVMHAYMHDGSNWTITKR